jgi:hypothetical protein
MMCGGEISIDLTPHDQICKELLMRKSPGQSQMNASDFGLHSGGHFE